MRQFDAATQTYFASRSGIVAHALIWIVAKDRVTGVDTALGLWSGDQDAIFTIGGVARPYLGAGEIVGVEDIQRETGLQVRNHTLSLSGIAPGVEAATRAYDARLAPVEIHRALFDPVTNALVAEPHRMFKGWCDDLQFDTGAIGGATTAEMMVVSSARMLTRTLGTKKSDESQRLRSGDRFRRYAAVTGRVGVWWGEKRK
jgi:hypothetical protein